MSAEEQVVDIVDDVVDEVVDEEVEQLSEDETTARKYGWKPQEDWEGDPDEWVPAKVFNQRGELFGKIKSLERRNDEMQKSFKEMHRMLQKAQETEYKKAIKELEARKREAIESADADVAFEVEKEINELRNDFAESSKPQQVGPPQEFIEFKDRNDWYGDSRAMTAFADSVGIEYAQSHPNTPLSEVYAFVEKEVRSEFPEKFSNSKGKQMKEPKVEGNRQGSTASSGKKQKYTAKDLNEQQRSIMKTMTRAGAMTEDEYIAELVRIGEIG